MEIIRTTLENELSQSYLDYSMSVITNRALPDVRDGLKPIHRRILYTMHNLRLTYDKPHKKCARIVGDVLGRWHPHSDSACYEALVRLAQPFSLRYPLIDGQGNFGSVFGDEMASMRYTEARMNKITEYMFTNDMREIVEYKPNFSEDDFEPTVLPAIFPHLLVNGTTGIAVGMACSFVSNNLKETIEAIKAYIENKNITIEELMNYIKGPDFPTGGIIINQNDLLNIYKTGRGKVIIRGRYKIEEDKKYNTLVIYEIPYNTTVNKILEQINKLFENDKELASCIKTLRDESDENIRIVIEYDKNKITEKELINKIYKNSDMELNFNINNTGLINNRPKTFNLKELIQEYYLFQIEIIVNSAKVEQKKIIQRLHILEGYIKALDNIDDVIQLIKTATNNSDALAKLQNNYNMSQEQAKAVLDLKLSRLTALSKQEILEEQNNLTNRNLELEEILTDDNVKDLVLINKLNELLKFADERRTTIIQLNETAATSITKQQKNYPITIFIDENYAIKHNTKLTNYKYKFSTTSDSSLLIFTNKNKIYKLPATSTGKIHTLLQLVPTENILLILDTKSAKNGSLLFTTAKGKTKKVPITEFIDIKRNNVSASKVAKDDRIITINEISDKHKYVVFIASNGHMLKTSIDNISEYGKNASGVMAMKLKEDEEIVFAKPVIANEKLTIYYKTKETQVIDVANIGAQNRGTKGTKLSTNIKYMDKITTNHN